MVASSQPLATAAGLRALRAGGNAADAAVATAAALNVTEPNMTGIGGDCFALYYDAETRAVSALNGSGRAPAGLSIDLLRREGLGDELPRFHAHTVTVPGACAGWCDLLERHGSLPRQEVLAPAIELAEGGFPVAPITAFLWKLGAETQLCRSPGGRELTIDGRAPQAGELFRNPTLAGTLRRVADKGAEAFYTGEVAGAIAAVVQEHGGVLTEQDLAEHRSSWEEPIFADYGGLRVWECPPNGQGLTALLALGILRGLDLVGQDPLSAGRLHLLIETMRLAFADARRHIADPTFAAIPLDELLSEDYAAQRRAEIRPDRANPDPRFGRPLASSDTVYMCAVDGRGNGCSFINSNYMAFGTGLVPPGFGFTLQNRGHSFSLDPDHANALEPRKRPYHTIIPGLLTRTSDGSLYGPFGVMGGFMQPQGHVQVVVGMTDDGLDPQAALDRPRFHLVGGAPRGAVALELGVPEETVAELARRGHDVSIAEGWGRVQFGRGQIIRRDASGVLWGGSDPRADGCAGTLVE
ncbi:MAG: gamma-glutamyltransferase family protein [Proteobacteria bacterium]|nr:gamma-glutamyltransferase family protein [Pseudomonadota bacterium]